MNKKIISSMVKKDIKSLWMNKKAWVPMLLVTMILCLIVPVVITYVGTYTEGYSSGDLGEIQPMIDKFITHFPDGTVKEDMQGLSHTGEQFVFLFLNFLLLSIFLMVTVINSMLTATSSFVGEKERGTLETLMYSPITIKELFVSKLFASLIPALGVTYGAYILSCIVVNAMAYPSYHQWFMLDVKWLILMVLVVPALVVANILCNVFISAKVKTFQEAQQFGGLLVLPIVGLIGSQSTGLFFLNSSLLMVIGCVLLVLDVALLFIIVKKNSRNGMFESQVH